MPDLKLIAFDADDLAVLSAHLQDAVLRVGDMAYLPREQRFALLTNRFDWVEAEKAQNRDDAFQRRRTGLRFERVLEARLTKLDLAAKDTCLELLAVAFEPGEAPGGHVLLHFAGGAGVRLKVECIEAELMDLGAAWRTKCKPCHPERQDSEQAAARRDSKEH